MLFFILSWYHGFIKQTVYQTCTRSLQQQKSAYRTILISVPQGTILVLLYFLLSIINLLQEMPKKYEDDTARSLKSLNFGKKYGTDRRFFF